MGKNITNAYTYKDEDELYTPPCAITPLVDYIPINAVIWECADTPNGNSHISSIFRNRGNKVISTSIHSGVDFLACDIPEGVTHIITNPPFSLKDEFLKRCFEIGLPFALLLPIGALQSIKRTKMFYENNLELLVFDKRVRFINGKNAPNFGVAWFANGIFEKQLNFSLITIDK